jgi:hypothetical protein
VLVNLAKQQQPVITAEFPVAGIALIDAAANVGEIELGIGTVWHR